MSFSLSQSMAGTYSTPMGFLQEHGPPDTDLPCKNLRSGGLLLAVCWHHRLHHWHGDEH